MDSARALGVFVAVATCVAIATAVPARRGARVEDPSPASVEPGRFAQGVIEEIVGELRRRDPGREGTDGAQLDAMLRDLGVPVPRNGTPAGASDRSVAQAIQSRAGDEVNRRMPQLLTSLARLKSGRLPRRRPAPVASRPARPGEEPSPSPSAQAPLPATQAAVPFFGGGGGGGFVGTPIATPSGTPGTPPATPSAPPSGVPGAPSSPPDDPGTQPEPIPSADPEVPPVDTL